jgi:type IV secretory pathway VirJ component
MALACAAAAWCAAPAGGAGGSTAGASTSADAVPGGEPIRFERFGSIPIYREAAHPSEVVLFVSGDGGWNEGVVEMAQELSAMGAVVAGIDIRGYLRSLASSKEKCVYPAADFEALSQYLQKKLDLPAYTPPVLCGYSSGATLVYAVLAQAPSGTFKGGLSLGFCPDLPVAKPFCKGSGLKSHPGKNGKGIVFEPAASLDTPWIALQGTVDQVCDAAATESYVRKVGSAEVVVLPKVGHGFSVEKNWLPQFRTSFARLVRGSARGETAAPPAKGSDPATEGDPGKGSAAASAGDLTDLPLVKVMPKGVRGDTLAVLLSGDGGWSGLDKEVSKVLADKGIPVIGLNSLQYFWTRRTPDGAARDLERILRHFMDRLKSERVLLIGYSRGADVLPFLANRLPEDLLARVGLVALIGPAHDVDFEFHLSDWLGGRSRDTALPVLPEIGKLKGRRIACFYGEDEDDTVCPDLEPGLATPIRMAGGHHFGGNYSDIADRILVEAR